MTFTYKALLAFDISKNRYVCSEKDQLDKKLLNYSTTLKIITENDLVPTRFKISFFC